MEQKPKKKIRFHRVYCQCDEPIEYRYNGEGVPLYLKCGHCAEVIEAYTVNLGKDAGWLEKAEYEAAQRKKGEESKDAPASRTTPAAKAPEPQPFEAGEMVFYPTRVELQGVKICGDVDSGRIRRILDELHARDARDRYVAFSGGALAKKIGCHDRGQNGVAEAVRDFRKNVMELMRDEANLKVAPRDVIQSGGRGYRLTEKITVKDGDDPQSERDHAADGPVNDPDGDPINERQEWALEQLRAGNVLRIGHLMKQFPRSKTTAKRDLTDLRRRGLIEFEGSPRTGSWRLKGASVRPILAQGG